MGSSSLLARLTGMEIACEDEWLIQKFSGANSDAVLKAPSESEWSMNPPEHFAGRIQNILSTL